MTKTLLIRSDASGQIGTGHVMRCLALAHVARASWNVVFVCAQIPIALESRLTEAGFAVHRSNEMLGSLEDAKATAQLVQQLKASVLVLDGYQFDELFEQHVKSQLAPTSRMLAFDDEGIEPHSSVDVVLNQNHGAEQFAPNYSSYATALLGSRFALLRPEFLAWHHWQRPIPTRVSRILVTFGGSDPGNHSLRILQALEYANEPLEIRVLVGAANPHLQSLQAQVANSRHQLELYQNVTDIPTMLAWAEFAVSAAGSTIWELAFMNVPALVAVVAQNQTVIANAMDGVAGMRSLGWINKCSPDELVAGLQNAISRAYERPLTGRHLIDGWGAERVLGAINADAFWLRPVIIEDAQQIWQWANDSEVRQISFNADLIPWETHLAWLTQKLEDQRSVMLLASSLLEQADQPLGLVRFDSDGEYAVVSVILAAQARGRGLGARLLERATQRYLKASKAKAVHAFIKTENGRSVRAFEKAGYAEAVETFVQGATAWRLSYARDKHSAEPGGRL